MSEQSWVAFEQRGGITLATVQAARVLDAENISEFGREVLAYVRGHPGAHLLMDFEHVAYLSSAALAELLRIKGAAEAEHGGLRLCRLNENIRRVFAITNFDRLFTLYDDVDGALKRYERSLALDAEEQAWEEGGT